MYNLPGTRKENRNTVHQTERWANLHIPLKECEQNYTDMRTMSYIHDHASYEWKEARNADLSRSLMTKALSKVSYDHILELTMLPRGHELHYCFWK